MDELGLHMLSNAITFRKDVRINVNATDSDEEPEQNRYDAAERFEKILKRMITEKKKPC